MAVEIRGVTSGNRVASTPQTTATVTFHGSVAVGDLMVLFVTDASGTTTWPSGWTLADNSDTATQIVARTYYKVATSGDVSAGSTTYTNSNTTYGGGWVLVTVKAGTFDTTTPLTLTKDAAESATSTSHTPAPVSLSMSALSYGLYYCHRRIGGTTTASVGTAQTVSTIPGAGLNGIHALYTEGSFTGSSRAVTWNTTGDFGFYAVTARVNPSAKILTIKSGVRASLAGSIPFPASLAVGDEMLLFIGNDGPSTAPSGWTLQSGSIAGTNINAAIYRKTATSGDISAGSVAYTTADYPGGWVLATFATGTTFAYVTASRDTGLATSMPLTVGSLSVAAGDVGLYWIHRRTTSYATTTSTAGVGLSDATLNLGTNGGEQGLRAEHVAASGTRSVQWTSGSPTNDYGYYAVSLVATPPNVGATGSGTATAAVPTATGTGTATTFGSGTATAPTPTASGTGTSTVTASGTATAPTPTATGTGISDDTAFGTGTATAPAPTASGAGTSTVTGTGTAIAPTPTATGTGTSSAVANVVSSKVIIGSAVVAGEVAETATDYPVISSAVKLGTTIRNPLVPVDPPLGVLTQWPITRQAHLMSALSAADPRRAPGSYTIERGEIGRRHVFVNGVDVTYLRGVPARFADHTSSLPLGPASASIGLPQMKPWDVPGVGDLAPLDMDRDPAVEIVMVRPDDSVEQVWEGFLASDEDSSGENREDYTFHAEGLFAQAMHQPHDPPVFMDSRDIGHVVADVLNAVIHRRWNTIPRVTTGILTRNRGRSDQSVWQYVQDLLSVAWTDDERQWSLMRVGAYTYRIAVKADTTTAQWTVTKGAPGVECSLVTDQATRRDCIYGSGYASDGGYWEGRVFPGLEFGIPPTYPMAGFADMDVGTTDAMTTTGNGVTTWQRKMRELGYPVTVDGVMNAADTKWVRRIQIDAGLLVDDNLGPQTFAATWENNSTDVDLTTYRLPLATLPSVEPWLYSATGARIGTNPADDPTKIRHANPPVKFPPGIAKSEAIGLAQRMLARDQVPGVQGRIVLTTDPHETGSSRFDIKPGDNVRVIGHRGGATVQVSEVSVSDLTVTLTVDSRARDALTVEAILERNQEARRDPSARNGVRDQSQLGKAQVVQYESESRAGFVPRTAVNGNAGLWTVRKTFVSQVGVAKVEFTTSPKAEMWVALFNRPIRISVLASLVGDPSASADGWYDNVDVLREKFGMMEVFGTPESPGGYWPRQKAGDNAGPLTGKLRDSSSSLYDSPYGGFVWVAMFTSVSAWVDGRVFPAVPT